MSGRNGSKIDRIAASVKAGLNVLADKPWILKSADLGKLEATLAEADRSGVVAYDIMTERFEVTSILQRALVNDPAVFGEMLKGTEDDPAVYMESVHYLMKTVAGAPNDPPGLVLRQHAEGEGLNDVGTHLVDLVQWTLFPDQAIDYRRDIQVLAAQRWATPIDEAGFSRVTGERGFPAAFAPAVKDGRFDYFCNTLVSYTLRGVHTKLNVIWDWEPAPGSGDTHYAFYKGSRARVEVRQTQADKLRPELYVVPASAGERGQVLDAVRARVAALQKEFAGVDGGGAGQRDPRRHSRHVPRRPRGALRRGDAGVPADAARPPRAAGLGAPEHAGEVLRDDDRDRVEPPAPAAGRAAHRAEVATCHGRRQ